jgi:hypothetical protein
MLNKAEQSDRAPNAKETRRPLRLSAAHSVLAAINKSLAQSNKSPDHWRKYDEGSPAAPHFTGSATSVVQKMRSAHWLTWHRPLGLVRLNRSGAVAGALASKSKSLA